MYKIPANTLFVGKNVVFVPECHSTNTLALELAQNQSTAEGMVVITSYQTAGRGQRGNTWVVEPGKNVTLSILLKPSFLMIKDQFFLNIITSLAVWDTLKKLLTADIRIKWPNDILVNEGKICGILVENQIRGSVISTSVVGIGLNVNQLEFGGIGATSMRRSANREFDLQEIFETLVSFFEKRYLQLRENKMAGLKSEYLEQLFAMGVVRNFRREDELFAGSITGVNDHGELEILVDGDVRTFRVKEITFV